MKADMLNQLFRPSIDWSIPAPLIYIGLGIIGASLLIHLVIVLARRIRKWERRENRYERLLRKYRITPAERICLDHCRADLGIRDKAAMLTDPEVFQRVVKWAQKHRESRVAVIRIQGKLEAHKRAYPAPRRHRKPVHGSPPMPRAV